MIWQNAWAWLGLITLAVPVLVHLLARRRARVERFPTLRFLRESRLIAIRRSRPSDLVLLAVRLGILAFAVAALAQPYFMGGQRAARQADLLSRAVVVDTSASVPDAQTLMTADTAQADFTTLMETTAPAVAVRGAVAWLRTQPGRHEIVIISDMQRGEIDSIDLARVPLHIGLDLRKTGSVIAPGDPGHRYPWAFAADDGTRTVWRGGGEPVEGWAERDSLIVLHAPADSAAARALNTAAVSESGESLRPVAIVLPGYADIGSVAAAAQSLDEPWMGDVVAALHRDPLLVGAASGVGTGAAASPSPFRTIMHAADGSALIEAAAAELDGTSRLVLLAHTPPASIVTAAIVARAAVAARATAGLNATELEPDVMDDAEVAGWRRTAGPVPTDAQRSDVDAGSHGRWLWLLVLMLIGVETWLRHRADPPQTVRT